MRLPLKSNKHFMLFSVYAPTLLADLSLKNNFHSDLRRHLSSTPADDKALVFGDFNATDGRDSMAWKGVSCRHDIGNCDDNGLVFGDFNATDGRDSMAWKGVSCRHDIGNCDDKALVFGDFNATDGRDSMAWKGVSCRHDIGNCDDFCLVFGDFNATDGRDSMAWKGVSCRHDIGNSDDNVCFLLEFCTECQLSIQYSKRKSVGTPYSANSEKYRAGGGTTWRRESSYALMLDTIEDPMRL